MTGLNSLYKCRNGCKIGDFDALPVYQGLCIRCTARETGMEYEPSAEDRAYLEYLLDPKISVEDKLNVIEMRFAAMKKKAANGNGDSTGSE